MPAILKSLMKRAFVDMCLPLPLRPWVSELRKKGIRICLEKQRPAGVLAGDDIYGRLLTGKREILHCG
jgi:hypothetical protein